MDKIIVVIVILCRVLKDQRSTDHSWVGDLVHWLERLRVQEEQLALDLQLEM